MTKSAEAESRDVIQLCDKETTSSLNSKVLRIRIAF